MTFFAQHADLILCLALCTAVTVALRVVPLFTLGANLPRWFKDWLNFIPAAVMAALVAPDICFYESGFNLNPASNLFLFSGIISLIFCWKTKSFFGTIIVAMGVVAGMRALGWG